MTRRPWVLHPFLIAPLPILRLYASNRHSIPIRQVLMPSSLALGAAGLLFGVLRLVKIDGPRAGLIVSGALVFFFGFDRLRQFLGQLGVVGDRPVVEGLTLAVEGLALAGIVVVLLRDRPSAWRMIHSACNAGSVFLVGFWAVAQVGEPSGALPAVVPPVAPRMDLHPSSKPDVYYLILDAYGRSDVLKTVHGFDNSGFLGRLESQGFFIARRATSNYCQTALSLASTLNGRYLEEFAGSRSESRLPLRDLIQRNLVFQAFQAQGYKIVSYASGFDATELTGSDAYLAPRANLRGFEALIVDQTPIWLLIGRRSDRQSHRMHRERILSTLEHWPESPKAGEGPTFHFAHVLAPHPPFDFGADGRDTSSREGPFSLGDGEAWRRAAGHGGPEEYEARYRDQAAYLTSRVEQAVAAILAHHGPKNPPIIILQGDHGPGSHFETTSDRPNDLMERMSILYAVHLPQGKPDWLDNAITPVNTFRVVLDRYFGSTMGRLPDRNFYSPYATPYRFTDVTGELKGE